MKGDRAINASWLHHWSRTCAIVGNGNLYSDFLCMCVCVWLWWWLWWWWSVEWVGMAAGCVYCVPFAILFISIPGAYMHILLVECKSCAAADGEHGTHTVYKEIYKPKTTTRKWCASEMSHRVNSTIFIYYISI